VVLKLVFVSRALDRRITPRSRQRNLHWFVEQLEPLDLLDGSQGRLRALKDDEGLALGFEIRLRDDVDDGPIFGKDGLQRLPKLFGFDALFQISNVHAADR
jgi:hypothetical protein